MTKSAHTRQENRRARRQRRAAERAANMIEFERRIRNALAANLQAHSPPVFDAAGIASIENALRSVVEQAEVDGLVQPGYSVHVPAITPEMRRNRTLPDVRISFGPMNNRH
jgi:predicted alpha/beta-hydrolase family hydrolase